MTATKSLGSEHDDAVKNALFKVLSKMGAEEVSRNWGVVGSQEINTLKFTLKGQPLMVEAETYMGLSISGEQETVECIAAQVREIIDG